MSTPVINAIENVNQTSLNNLFTAIAQNQTARDNLSRSDRNIDKVSTNVGVIEAVNTNEDAILRILCRREGRDPSNFSTLDSVAADQSLMQNISARQSSSKILARSKKASTAAAASQTAMQELSTSQTSMQELADSLTAMTEIDKNDFAVRAIMCGTTTLDPTTFADADAISKDAAAMQEIAGNATTMNTLAESQTAMDEIDTNDFAVRAIMCGTTSQDPTTFADANAISQDAAAMSEIAQSQTTMKTLAASQTAMQEIAASQTAMTEIDKNDFAVRAIMCGITTQDPATFADADAVSKDAEAMSEIAASQTTMNTIAASQTAMQEVANSQTAMNEIASSANETIAASTVLNSSISTTEFKNSNLEESIVSNFGNGITAGRGTITNSRVLVTSNNTSGDQGTSITFTNNAGPETQLDTTFIANKADIIDGNSNSGGSISITGIQIN